MMGWRQAGVGGCLASALKALGIPEFCEYERGSRLANTRDRFQELLLSSKGVGALDVIIDRLFQSVDLLVDAFEHRLERVGDRRIARLVDLVFEAVTLLFEALKTAGHVLQIPLLGRGWLPGAWLFPVAEAGQKPSVYLVGFRAGELAVGVGARTPRIPDLWRSVPARAKTGQPGAGSHQRLRDRHAPVRSSLPDCPQFAGQSNRKAVQIPPRYSARFERQSPLLLLATETPQGFLATETPQGWLCSRRSQRRQTWKENLERTVEEVERSGAVIARSQANECRLNDGTSKALRCCSDSNAMEGEGRD